MPGRLAPTPRAEKPQTPLVWRIAHQTRRYLGSHRFCIIFIAWCRKSVRVYSPRNGACQHVTKRASLESGDSPDLDMKLLSSTRFSILPLARYLHRDGRVDDGIMDGIFVESHRSKLMVNLSNARYAEPCFASPIRFCWTFVGAFIESLGAQRRA